MIKKNLSLGPPRTPKLTLEQVQLDVDRSDLEKFLAS